MLFSSLFKNTSPLSTQKKWEIRSNMIHKYWKLSTLDYEYYTILFTSVYVWKSSSKKSYLEIYKHGILH